MAYGSKYTNMRVSGATYRPDFGIMSDLQSTYMVRTVYAPEARRAVASFPGYARFMGFMGFLELLRFQAYVAALRTALRFVWKLWGLDAKVGDPVAKVRQCGWRVCSLGVGCTQ